MMRTAKDKHHDNSSLKQYYHPAQSRAQDLERRKVMKDLVYEFFKLTARESNFNLPSEEAGSGYREVYSVSELDLSNINPEEILLVRSGSKENSVMKQVRLMDAGYEILHSRVLLGLLHSGRVPESWKDKHNIDFLGAWFCATGNWKACCNPMTVSVFWHMHRDEWCISYDGLTDTGYDHYIAVIKKRGDE